MDTASVFRLMSLIPDRMPRSQSGSTFDRASSQQAEILARFLGWLGPLNPISKEDQQLLGARVGVAKPMLEGEGEVGEAGEAPEDAEREPGDAALEDQSDQPIRLPGAGTHIAA